MASITLVVYIYWSIITSMGVTTISLGISYMKHQAFSLSREKMEKHLEITIQYLKNCYYINLYNIDQ